MSDAKRASMGAFAQGYVAVEEMELRGMITVRGSLTSSKLTNAVNKVSGADMPGPGQINFVGEYGLAWMSPDELLMLTPYKSSGADMASLEKLLEGTHHLVTNVSDARITFRLTGVAIREVLSKLTPANVSVVGLQIGQIRRSRLAQVAGAFWLRDDETAEIVCFRSVAHYVFSLLENASRPGSEVGYV